MCRINVCDLTGAFDLSGPTISHHLKVLREAGLIEGERRATWIYYRVRLQLLRLASPKQIVKHPAVRSPARIRDFSVQTRTT